jgi:hypothetical protein
MLSYAADTNSLDASFFPKIEAYHACNMGEIFTKGSRTQDEEKEDFGREQQSFTADWSSVVFRSNFGVLA